MVKICLCRYSNMVLADGKGTIIACAYQVCMALQSFSCLCTPNMPSGPFLC